MRPSSAPEENRSKRAPIHEGVHPPPPIVCRNLVKKYGDKVAVAGIDLEIPKGICFGLLGRNGAGKTTTVEILEGLNSPTSGTVELFGHKWSSGHDKELRRRIGVTLQETQLADKQTVVEVLRLFRSFYDGGRNVPEVLRAVQLEAEQNQRYTTLSGGQKQRVALATALVGGPDLLFLDEPTTGLDPHARQLLWAVVDDFREGGGTVVLTTHYMEEAATLCDQIAIMDTGRIIARGTPSELVDSLGDVQFVEFVVGSAGPNFSPERLLEIPVVTNVETRRDKLRLTLARDLEALALVLSKLSELGVVPVGLSSHQATLDDVFLHLTGKELGAA
jgi:ABC-2 type transport system ATP-binding protein